MRGRLTPQSEDCLKAIYALSRKARANTLEIAGVLGISGASVTAMLKRLADLKLIDYLPYQGANLTPAGEQVALEIVRHHRLLETYLHQALGVPLESLHAEADRLEHHISEELEARIFAALGEPTHDPHGDPIPTLTGAIPFEATCPLAEAANGEVLRVGRVSGRDAVLLKHLSGLGIVPGASLEVLEIDPLSGVVRLLLAGQELTIGLEVARCVWVEAVVSV
jgi:DtxR family transcriptional regulator, Mn-dependent transcriptional regulator